MKKKGFTLIELLAVIVILAIIALIAVPIVLNMIENARKSAAKSSAYGYIQAIEDNNELAEMNDDYQTGRTTIEDGTDKDISTITLNIKGKKPTKGKVTIANGKVSSATLCINNYKVTYTAPEVTGVTTDNSYCGGGSTPAVSYNPGDVVYFDPVENDKCTTFNVNAINNGTSSCYKWRVITVGDTPSATKITLQLDHNLTDVVAFVTQADYNDNANWGQYGTGNANKGPITALRALSTATNQWDDSLLLNYSYNTSASSVNYGTLTCTNGTCTNGNGDTIATNVKARMITGEEVKSLVLNAGAASDSLAGTWAQGSNNKRYYFSNTNYILGTFTTGTGNTDLSWLVENTTVFNGVDSSDNLYGDNNSGYWSLSISTESTPPDVSFPNVVDIGGKFDSAPAQYNSNFGVRPVITINKSQLQ